MTRPRSRSPLGAGAPIRRAGANAATALRDLLAWPLARWLPRGWLVLRLDHGLVEGAATRPAWLDPIAPAPRSFARVQRALELAASDRALRGVLLRVGTRGPGWAGCAMLERALGDVQAAGKRIVVYAENAGNAGAWLGARAERFWMTPQGRLDLLGVRAQSWFFRRALDAWGIRAEVISAGEYKSAGEPWTRTALSERAREALEPVVEELYERLVHGLTARAGDAARARRWIDEGPYLAAQALEQGIVDELVYADELPRKLAQLEGQDEGSEASFVSEAVFRGLARPRFRFAPLRGPGREISLVSLSGLIRPGAGASSGIVGLLRSLEHDDGVAAVVLRIDSPGGDVLASDLISRAVSRLREHKPVVASMGDVAASGGYSVAMVANEIVAEPTSLTGSIGVILAGLNLTGLLGRIGLDVDGLDRGRHAAIYDFTRPRPAHERALLREQVQRIYRGFVAQAAAARGLDGADLERVARGRVWTGRAAQEVGLVDSLGGLERAIERARELAGLRPGRERVRLREARRTWLGRARRAGPLESLQLGAQTRAWLWCPIRIPLS